MTNKQFPEWALTLYRGARAAVGAGIAQTIILRPDWTDTDEALRTLAVAFLAGFSVSFGKFLRDWIEKQFGLGEKSIVAKSMPI